MVKIIPKENKCKKAKWLSEEALKIAEKRREAKGKGQKERYTHLSPNAQGKKNHMDKSLLSKRALVNLSL